MLFCYLQHWILCILDKYTNGLKNKKNETQWKQLGYNEAFIVHFDPNVQNIVFYVVLCL